MNLQGKLIAESPLYRGNMRKTLFTREGDGTHRLISLAGEVAGTAQALMDAFIGRSRDGRNIGLLNRLWQRLYDAPMPDGLISRVDCKLQEASYPRERFFDLRMGIRLDEDRWAIEANANYKMETVLRHSVFDFEMTVNDGLLQQGDNQARLYYLLEELRAGRFWFGAGKTKGLGRLRLEMDLPFSAPETPPAVNPRANHLQISVTFHAANPVLVGWNWGKVAPEMPAFVAIEGRLLVEAMRDVPEPIRERLALVIGGPILSPEDWKQKLAEYLPRTIAVWLQEQSAAAQDAWIIPEPALEKLGKAKRYPLSKKVIEAARPLTGKPFPSREAAETALQEALGKKAHMAKRILEVMVHTRQTSRQLNQAAWQEVAGRLGLAPALSERLAEHIDDEEALVEILKPACAEVLPRLYEQVDHQIRLLQSDTWVDEEIAEREEHIRIKTMLLEGKISEEQWGDPTQVPEGISPRVWREFIDAHRHVRYRHMLQPRNLQKSITNDRNLIAFLKSYRDRVRQELAQPYHIDFRIGGPSGREVSRKYGKPYDTVFTRMLSWAPATEGEEGWEIYIPGSTIKGAFRKRASQVLRTLWGESEKMTRMLQRLFGTEGERGLLLFSDAYLLDPYDPERAWCSMDGVMMDPQTGRPVEAAKRDYLFAYGDHLRFQFRIDLQDVGEEDLEALSVLSYLLQDFGRGDIPLGGEKTSGLGWVQGTVTRLEWLTGDPQGVGETLFGERPLVRDGIWYRLALEEEAAAEALRAFPPLVAEDATPAIEAPPRAAAGFVSHRAFGGHCGLLVVEAEVLTPLHVQESGEPSHKAVLDGGPVNGWDFFSMAPPEAAQRPSQRTYALPSLSLRGMLRHIYAIASDAREPSSDLEHLNAVDRVFGWVGRGPNQALMGRLSVSFGFFEAPELAWFKVPYPYGEWQYTGKEWQRVPGRAARQVQIAKTWRLFPHAPLAPIVEQLEDFRPDTVQASYCRAILPGARARFTIRFWNLDDEELQRLVWCVALEPGLAHKMGKHRYLGFGSLRLHVLPESYLIDWVRRYAGKPEEAWKVPLQVDEWRNPKVVKHVAELRKVLNAERL